MSSAYQARRRGKEVVFLGPDMKVTFLKPWWNLDLGPDIRFNVIKEKGII